LTLEDLGNLGEFVGAIAVVVTLVYLALQIRQNTAHLAQNTRSVQLAALEANVQSGNRVRELLIMDPKLSDLHLKGLEEYAQLDRNERLRFAMLLQNLFSTLQASYFRTRILRAPVKRRPIDGNTVGGDLYPTPFSDGKSLLDSLLEHPGVREWWDRNQGHYHPEFIEVVKERMAHLGNAG
jgi:hypothetical protein